MMPNRLKRGKIGHEFEEYLEQHGGEASSPDLRHYFCPGPKEKVLKRKKGSAPEGRTFEEMRRRLDRVQSRSFDTCAHPWFKKTILDPRVKDGRVYVASRLKNGIAEKCYVLSRETREYLKLAKEWAKIEQNIPLFRSAKAYVVAYSHLTRAWQIASAIELEAPERWKVRQYLEEDASYVDNVYEKLPKGAKLITSTESEEERKQRENFYKETGGSFTVDFPASVEDGIARAAAFEKACIAGVAAARYVRAELESQLKKRKDKELGSST
jgi:hypothetical protein